MFGFYKKENDLIELLKALLTLINGTADISIPEEEMFIKSFVDQNKKPLEVNIDQNLKQIKPKVSCYRLRSRYQQINENNNLLMEAKKIICEILVVIFNMRTESRITCFLTKF